MYTHTFQSRFMLSPLPLFFTHSSKRNYKAFLIWSKRLSIRPTMAT